MATTITKRVDSVANIIVVDGVAGDGYTDNALARFSGTDGSLQNSSVIVDDNGNVSGIQTLSLTSIELGNVSDTTLTRVSPGVIAVEGNAVYLAGGTDVAVADGGTGASTAAGAATNLGLGTGDSPQFTGLNIGHATDTTIARASAGVIAVEGSNVIMASNKASTAEGQAGTDDAHYMTPATTKSEIDAFVVGASGRLWVDVKSQRAIGTTYYNTNAYPIEVAVSVDPGSGQWIAITAGNTWPASAYVRLNTSVIIPPGMAYSVQSGGGSPSIDQWSELR